MAVVAGAGAVAGDVGCESAVGLVVVENGGAAAGAAGVAAAFAGVAVAVVVAAGVRCAGGAGDAFGVGVLAVVGYGLYEWGSGGGGRFAVLGRMFAGVCGAAGAAAAGDAPVAVDCAMRLVPGHRNFARQQQLPQLPQKSCRDADV
jgi:hypothetical protein